MNNIDMDEYNKQLAQIDQSLQNAEYDKLVNSKMNKSSLTDKLTMKAGKYIVENPDKVMNVADAMDFVSDIMDPDKKMDISMGDVVNKIGQTKGGFKVAFKILVVGVVIILAVIIAIFVALVRYGMNM
ncbi:hypothetical protein [Butyrivibrio sp. INlla14]|uniref:hypothetical protein n=1 Tax=Butyrivibrio sp. INlla14 TaxID=1520808 RepID=UPI000875F913|nr:hypothetical protein [Butyrivibrio sp. INlla14]SCY69026.1 hypothetical protein SAMN02910371_03400 [Butyrivibrio sp. INlla14]